MQKQGALFLRPAIFYQLLYEIKKQEPFRQKELIQEYFHFKEADQFKTEATVPLQETRFTSEFGKLFEFKAGAKFFFPSSLHTISPESLRRERRSIDYVFPYPFTKSDTTVFHLTGRFSVDNLPKDKFLENEYILYKRQISTDQKSIRVITTLILKERIIPPAAYLKVAEALADVENDEAGKLILTETPGHKTVSN